MTLLFLNLIAAIGGFVVGLSGFGLVLVCVPLFALLIDVKVAIVASALMGWACTIPIAFRMREHIKWLPVAILLLGAIPGSFLGAMLLHNVPSHYILITMALIIICSSVYCLQLREGQKKQASKPTTIATGLASGMLGSSVGEAGPPIVSYSMMQPWTAEESKATMLAFFVFQMAAAVASFFYEGLIDFNLLHLTATMTPGLIIGVVAGLSSFSWVQRKRINYHKAMHYALIIIAIYILIRSI